MEFVRFARVPGSVMTSRRRSSRGSPHLRHVRAAHPLIDFETRSGTTTSCSLRLARARGSEPLERRAGASWNTKRPCRRSAGVPAARRELSIRSWPTLQTLGLLCTDWPLSRKAVLEQVECHGVAPILRHAVGRSGVGCGVFMGESRRGAANEQSLRFDGPPGLSLFDGCQEAARRGIRTTSIDQSIRRSDKSE